MSIMSSVRKWAVVSSVLAALFSCTGEATSLRSLEPPEGARNIIKAENADPPSKELSFSVVTEHDGYSIVHEMEDRLRALKYERCDKRPGRWEVIERGKADGGVTKTRVLRFYTTGAPGQLAALVAYQQCEDKDGQCTQNFTIRQQIAPSSVPNRDRYMGEICQ